MRGSDQERKRGEEVIDWERIRRKRRGEGKLGEGRIEE